MADNVQEELTQYNQILKRFDAFYSGLAKLCGLTDCVFWIIYSILDSPEPLTQTELCSTWSLHKQTINTALKNLETDGMISLRSPEQNRKNKQIFLTEKGRAFAQRTVIPYMEMEQRAFGALEEEERKEMLRLNQKLLALLQTELNRHTDF
ncbi:MAG: MarR family transcriptional regulator [Lachnospiraceae bacterium]|nr:MarR family transcriptional regulator [Lachnospiraceae bacterium]